MGMCDGDGGCESVRFDGEELVVDLACGDDLTLDIRDYDTDEPLPHAFDGGGTKLWADGDDRYWLGVV